MRSGFREKGKEKSRARLGSVRTPPPLCVALQDTALAASIQTMRPARGDPARPSLPRKS